MSLQFICRPADAAVQPVVEYICRSLEDDKHVLWLLTGGSAIPKQVSMMAAIRYRAGNRLNQLNILLGDERYGPAGHENSNYQLLTDVGFNAGAARWQDVLAKDLPLNETVEYYTELMRSAQAEADTTIALFGIGPDAHIAGIKPDSPAVSEDMATVVGYEWDDFTRLTLTPRELVTADIAFALVYGAGKRGALERLRDGREPVRETPCNILHKIPEVYVYNDQLADEEK